MMILSDNEIRELYKNEEFLIENMNDEEFEDQLQSISVDLRIETGHYDPEIDQTFSNPPIVFQENKFYYVSSREEIKIPNNLCGFYTNRFSVAKSGLMVSQGFIHPGYKGKIVAWVYNPTQSPVKYKPRDRFFQLILFQLTSRPDQSYGERPSPEYQSQTSPE